MKYSMEVERIQKLLLLGDRPSVHVHACVMENQKTRHLHTALAAFSIRLERWDGVFSASVWERR